MRRLLTWVVIASALGFSQLAVGQEQNKALATELFETGRALMDEGRFAEACPKLAESARLNPAVGTLGKLATCEEHIGKLMLARAHWQQARNRARADGDDRLALIEQQLQRLEATVPKLRIEAPRSRPAGLHVNVDGTAIGNTAFGVPLPVDPGTHRLEVSAPDREPKQVEVIVHADGATTVVQLPSLDAPVPRAESSPAPLPPRDVEDTTEATHPLRSVGLVVAGVGAVGMGVGAYFGGLAKSRLDESNELGCNGAICTSEAAEKRNDARDAGNTSTAFFVAGGALAAGGLALWLFGPAEREQPAVSGGAMATPRGADITFVGRF